MTEGPKYGYYPKPSKSFLIVKQHYKEYGERIFAGSNIKITTEGVRHLGAVLGDSSFKEEYLRNEIQSWNNQLETLSKIAEIQRHTEGTRRALERNSGTRTLKALEHLGQLDT